MEVESPPSFSLDQSDDERAELSISELIYDLRSAFRSSDFDRVEEILVSKENKMKKQITELESETIRLDLEVKRLSKNSSESRISRENYEIMRKRVKVAEEGMKLAEEKAREAGDKVRETEEKVVKAEEGKKLAWEKAKKTAEMLERLRKDLKMAEEKARVTEEKVIKAEEGMKLAEEKTKIAEEMLERLRKDLKKNEREKLDEISQIMEKNNDFESEENRAEDDNEVWKKILERVMKAQEETKLAREKAKETEGMLEQLRKELKKNEREKLDGIAQVKVKNKVLESGENRVVDDNEVWKKTFEELEKRVTLLEAETETVLEMESLVTKVTTARDSTESNKANGEKGTGENDHHLPSPPTSPMNQDFLSDKKSDFEQQTIVIIDSDDENAPPRTNLHDKGPIDLTYKGPIDLTYKDPIDLTDWDIKPILSKRKRSCSPNASGSKRKLDGATPTKDAKNRKSPSKHVQVEYEEKTREDKSSPTTFNKLTVGDESGAFNFEVSSSSDKQTSSSYHSDASVDLDEIFSQSQKPI